MQRTDQLPKDISQRLVYFLCGLFTLGARGILGVAALGSPARLVLVDPMEPCALLRLAVSVVEQFLYAGSAMVLIDLQAQERPSTGSR
jgi:hypothetical protein